MELKIEEYKDIPGYIGLYKISKNGVIINSSDKVMKVRQENKGYIKITLNKKGVKTTFRVHQLVMNTFNPEGKKKSHWEVHHKNDTPTDNRLDNLEWLPHSINVTIRNKRNAKKTIQETEGPF